MEKHLMKECVTLEQARLLKEIGFNEPFCYGYYDGETLCFNDANHTNESEDSNNLVLAPTYQHAFRWIRERYTLHHISYMNQYYMERWFTYEDAESRSLNSLINEIKGKIKNDV